MKIRVIVPPGFVPPPSILDWEFEMKWRMGARTAVAIAERTKLYQANVFLKRDGLRVPANSIMGMMLLGNFGIGGRVKLMVRGPDAMAAFADLVDFFGAGAPQTRCPTAGCDSLPCLVECCRSGMIYSCMKFHTYQVPRTDEPRRN